MIAKRQDLFQVKCPDCGEIKTTYASLRTQCPYCGKWIYVRKCRVSK